MRKWLLALAQLARTHTGSVLPRHHVYIVNPRTVVDQATSIANGLRTALARSALRDDCEALGGLAGDRAQPLAISTLRGELADNEDWKRNPARPAVIVGTVDMFGRKLLSGYGDERRRRPMIASRFSTIACRCSGDRR